jgi:hypothetical protein
MTVRDIAGVYAISIHAASPGCDVTSIGEQLIALRDRSGLTLNQVASAASYRGRSSVQKFFVADYDPPFLDMSVAKRLARAFVGTGEPEITEAEIFELAGGQADSTQNYTHETAGSLKQDVAIYLASFAKRSNILRGQEPLSTYFIELDNPVGYAWHPPTMRKNTNIYAIRIQKNPLVPRYLPGECMFLDAAVPPKLGDEVCVYYDEFDTPSSEHRVISSGALVLFGTLERHTIDALHLRTIDGNDTFFIRHDEVKQVHRVVTLTGALVP